VIFTYGKASALAANGTTLWPFRVIPALGVDGHSITPQELHIIYRALEAPKHLAMDLAYDHIQEEALAPEEAKNRQEQQPETTLNADFQEAYKAISSSPWGAKLGGFFGSVVKQVLVIHQVCLASSAD
jgi:hypothetical protein